MKVIFRTDASVEIGSGHLMRCLTLADQLREEGAEAAFICRDLPGSMFDLLQARGYRFARLPAAEAGKATPLLDAGETIAAAGERFPEGADWLVVDHYGMDAVWERSIRPHVRRIMAIDDLANRPHDCDLLLDQNYYRDMERRYRGLVPEHCVTLLGPAYVLLRPEFVEARKKLRTRDGAVRRILIFFGGSDPTNQTGKALEAMKLVSRPEIAVDVVVGTANPYREAIRTACEELPNTAFHCQVSNMAELIANADLGIGAGGGAMWERCCLGLPTITVVFADNQQRTTEDVAGIGAIEFLGRADRLASQDYARAINGMLGDARHTKQVGDAALAVLQPRAVSLAKMMQRLVAGKGHLNSPGAFQSLVSD